MAWDSDLEGVHYRVAAEPGNPVHVLAGPGTGKTFAMMRRIARLLEEGGTPDQILAVSFTRTAARDLTHQLAALGVLGAEDVRASTLHALCYGILQQQAVFEVTGRIPRALLSPELAGMLNDLAGSFGGKRKVKSLLEAYEAGWARLQHDVVGAPVSEEDQRFAAELDAWLRYHRAMLIGELVPLTLTFLRQNPNVPVLPNLLW
jgi:DNA helicase II / ATP-dependent DNA helicase PcrA